MLQKPITGMFTYAASVMGYIKREKNRACEVNTQVNCSHEPKTTIGVKIIKLRCLKVIYNMYNL